MRLIASRISFWFNFFDCLKIAKFGSRVKYPFSFSRGFQLGTLYGRLIHSIKIFKNVCFLHILIRMDVFLCFFHFTVFSTKYSFFGLCDLRNTDTFSQAWILLRPLLEPLRPSQHYRIEVLKRALNLSPMMPRGPSLSDRQCKLFQSAH